MNKMKVLVPFYPLYVSTEREDYFKLCAEITGGDIIPSRNRPAFGIIKKIVRQNVHAQGDGFPFPLLAPLFAKRTVYSFVNNYIGHKWYAVLVRRFLLNMCDIVVVNSEYNRNNFIRQGIKEEKLKILPYPADYEYFSKPEGGEKFREKFGIGRDEKFAMTIGMGYHKNPEIIAEACKKAGIRLVIAGFRNKHESGERYPGFRASDAVGNYNNVIVTGYLSKEELLGAYDSASVYVNSSDSDGEVFAIAVYDAAGAGVPLCLPDYGTFDVFRGSALFHGNHDSGKLSENIRRYMNDSKLAEENAKNAKIIAGKYDAANVRKQFEQLYREIGFVT